MNGARAAILTLALMLCLALIHAIPPLKVPQEPSASIQELLIKGPVCFQWTEVMADASNDHAGGVVFLLADHKIFSRAWYTRAKYARQWPPVYGVGTAEGD